MSDYLSKSSGDMLYAGPGNTVPAILVPPSNTMATGSCKSCSSKSASQFSQSNGKSMRISLPTPTSSVQSWYDYPVQQPLDPRILIANVRLAAVGAFVRSTNFIGGATWIASPFSISAVTCASLHTDNDLAVAEAEQWTFLHQCGNFSATNPPALRKKIFMRGGIQYKMVLTMDLGIATYSDLQLSYRDNAATPGDFAGSGAGSIPAFKFASALTGPQTMEVTLNAMFGTHIMAISARDGSSNWSMFEMEWVVVP